MPGTWYILALSLPCVRSAMCYVFAHAPYPFILSSKTALFNWPFVDWVLMGLLLVVSRQSSRFYSVLFSGGGWCEGALLYGGRKSGGSSLPAFSASYARFARYKPSSKRVGGVGLRRRRQSYIRGVALSREPPKQQQAKPLLAKMTWIPRAAAIV